jgi:hypothetical protein
MRKLYLLLSLAQIFCVSLAFSQTAGRITGLITDSSNAGVPNAKVSAQNMGTGQKRITTSSANGTYVLADIPIGTYKVTVEQPGFQTVERPDIAVTVAETSTVNLTLTPGAISQVIEVQGQAEAIAAPPGANLSSTQVHELPINGRDFARFSFLTPGAVPRSNFISDMTFNGQHGVHNQFALDGIDATRVDQPYLANGFERGARLLSGSQETIAEFRVQTSDYQAQYGRAAGSFVNVASKSGTNEFHGTVFDYLRNDFLDARNFFNKKPTPQAAFRYNDFGGNIGGPIKANKTFFFANYEGSRQTIGITGSGTTLSAAARAQVLATSPALADIVNQFPIGTAATSNPLISSYTTVQALSVREDTGSIKLDHNFSDSDAFFFRLNLNDTQVNGPLFGVTSSALGVLDHQNVPIRTTNFAVHEQHIFNPRFLNEFLVGMQRFAGTIEAATPYPLVTISDLTIIPGTRGSSFSANTSYQLSDDMSYVVGAHSLKWGGLAYRIETDRNSLNTTSILYTNLASFIANQPSSATATAGNPGSATRTYNAGAYFQDTWQMRPGLTLDYGLRYDYFLPPFDPANRAQTFDTRTGLLAAPGTDYFHANKTNFQPRISLAWQAAPKFIIRAGYGIYYQAYPVGFGSYSVPTNNISGNASLVRTTTPNLSYPLTPFLSSAAAPLPTVAGFNWNKPDIYAQQWNFTTTYEVARGTTLQVGYIGNHGLNLRRSLNINLFDPALGRRPNTHFADINIEDASGQNIYHGLQASLNRRFSNGLQFVANYTWSHAIDDVQDQTNYSGSPQDLNNFRADRGNSSGDARHNSSFDVFYTLPIGRGQRFLSNAGGFADRVFGGWQLALLGNARTGIAANVVIPQSQTGNFNTANQRPNLVPGVDPYTANPSPDGFFNRAAFALPVGTFGNAGRNIVYGPSLVNFDVSVIKAVPLTERIRLQIRGEIFNVFNHPNFDQPNLTSTSASFGQIFNTLGRTIGFGTSRQIQLAARFNF